MKETVALRRSPRSRNQTNVRFLRGSSAASARGKSRGNESENSTFELAMYAIGLGFRTVLLAVVLTPPQVLKPIGLVT